MRKYLLPLLLSLAFFITYVLTLSDYGINWDAPMRMLRGQAYARFFLTGQKSYGQDRRFSPILITPLEYTSRYNFLAGEGENAAKLPERPLPKKEFEQENTAKRASFYASEDWNGNYFFSFLIGIGHLPLVDTLSAFSNRFFWGELGILGDIQSYQLIYLIFSALGVFLVSLFAFDITDSYLVAAVAGVSLGLFPIFFAESHFNMKDPVQAVFFTGSIWAFWRWVKLESSGSSRWFWVFGGFVALALGVKWNIIFLPFILIPWLFLIRKSKEFQRWFKLGRLLKFGVFGVFGVFLFLILILPAGWNNPFLALVETVKYYLQIGLNSDRLQPSGFILPFGFNIYPLILVLTQTPEIILALAGIGVVRGIRGIRGSSIKIEYLLLLWILVPVVRFSLPGTYFYSGFRQFMEVIPAMAILAGVGAEYLVSVIPSVARNLRDPSGFAGESFRLPFALRAEPLRMTIVIVTFAFLFIPILKYHPNENAYFNALTGGLKGAVAHNLVDWTLTYGNIYKQGVNWLNQNAPKDANLAILNGSMFAISPLFLRDDISISPYHFSGLDQKEEYIIDLYNPYNHAVFAHRYPREFLNPVKTILVDGFPLLSIYKNDPEFVKPKYSNEQVLKQFKVNTLKLSSGKPFYTEVDLGKKVKVTRILVTDIDEKCLHGNGTLVPDELVSFLPGRDVYGVNEKKDRGNNNVEFWFAGQEAQEIRIYPKSEFSCFIGGKISSISFLSE